MNYDSYREGELMGKEKKAKRIPTRKELLKASAAFMKLANMFKGPEGTGNSFWSKFMDRCGI